jgi:type VI secretion system secreted protein Hcp
MALVDYFLRIGGEKGSPPAIPGESKDKDYHDEIELESWSWGETQTGTQRMGGGGGAGKVAMQDFHCVMRVSKASPKLMLACAQGDHFDKVVLTCRKAGGKPQPYLTWTFTDVLISSYQSSGTSNGDILPTDQISLNFGTIQVDYAEQTSTGDISGHVSTKYNLKGHE